MLEKRDKSKKTTQLPLEEKDQGPSVEEQLRSKRRLVTILLIVTVGLSLIFWTYRSLKNFTFPTFSFPKASSTSPNISQLITTDSSSWSVYFKPKKSTAYTYNPDPSINDAFAVKQTDVLNKSKTDANLLTSVLPEGLVVKDNITETSSQIIYQGVINIPDNQIFFYLKINGQNLAESKKLIPQVIESYYWSVIKNL